MSSTQHRLGSTKDSKVTHELSKQEAPLKGTLVSVFLLGTFIIISWLSIFILFLARN